MALAVNIIELIHGRVIEWERLEFKKGWNPVEVMHTLCAFANDINNWGGGYIIIGIAEKDGRPVLPPEGLNPDSLDKLQGEITQICHKLQPNYMPLVQPYIYQEKHILVIWAPAGDVRPYSAPQGLGDKADKNRVNFIRSGSRTIIAQGDNLRRLQELTARIPFDDRIHQQALVNDLNLGLIRDFLQEINSDLAEEAARMPFSDLCRQMHIAKGPDEALRPVNAGLMFFAREPHRFFQRAWIEVVIRKDEAGKDFSEKYFKGPLHIQLRDALAFIRNEFIEERVQKVSGQEKARRFFNWPYDALEEALANAVYHKSYELDKPIEVQIWPDKIEILSFPGPVPPVAAQIRAENRRIVARDYRNRRVGDFLKELHLTEGRGTGIPTMYKRMKDNGSPGPIFETDEECTYFLSVLPTNPEFLSDQFSDQVSNQESAQESNQDSDQVNDQVSAQESNQEIVQVSNPESAQESNQESVQVSAQVSAQERSQLNRPGESLISEQADNVLLYALTAKSRKDILAYLELSNHFKNYQRHIEPLIELGWLSMTYPKEPKHRKQKYVTTLMGKEKLENATRKSM